MSSQLSVILLTICHWQIVSAVNLDETLGPIPGNEIYYEFGKI